MSLSIDHCKCIEKLLSSFHFITVSQLECVPLSNILLCPLTSTSASPFHLHFRLSDKMPRYYVSTFTARTTTTSSSVWSALHLTPPTPPHSTATCTSVEIEVKSLVMSIFHIYGAVISTVMVRSHVNLYTLTFTMACVSLSPMCSYQLIFPTE